MLPQLGGRTATCGQLKRWLLKLLLGAGLVHGDLLGMDFKKRGLKFMFGFHIILRRILRHTGTLLRRKLADMRRPTCTEPVRRATCARALAKNNLQTISCNVTPALMKVAAIVESFFVIQDPVTVLGVRYCGKFFPLPKQNKQVQACLFSTLWSGQAQVGLKLD